jgi:glutamate synthase domain-containing protein 1
MMMVVPDGKNTKPCLMTKAFYEYNACIMEPWDGLPLFRLLMEM